MVSHVGSGIQLHAAEIREVSESLSAALSHRRALAKKAVRQVQGLHRQRAREELQKVDGDKRKVRSVASSLSREVRKFWHSCCRVVQHAEDLKTDAINRKRRIESLEAMVSRTEKLSHEVSQQLEAGGDDLSGRGTGSSDAEDGCDESDEEAELVSHASSGRESAPLESGGAAEERRSAAQPMEEGLRVAEDTKAAESGPAQAQHEVQPPGPRQRLETLAKEMDEDAAFDKQQVTQHITTQVPMLLIRHPVREYQHVGLHWLATLHDKAFNGILADEMGLGKTIMTIALLAHLAIEKEVWGPHLIIVPTTLQMNWEMEFKKWAPGFKVLVYYGTAAERKLKRKGWQQEDAFHVCIVSYALVLQDVRVFRPKRWYYMILDEAQNIKNFRSQKWQQLVRFNSARRLLLTGTPLQNDLMELWSLMHFLMPDLFASYSEFKEWFSDPLSLAIQSQRVERECGLISRLHEVLRPFMLRRLKSEVEKQMPAKHEHVEYCVLTRRQQVLYDEFMHRRDTQRTLKAGNYLGMMNILMQLRKVCNHPELFEPRHATTPFTMSPIELSVPVLILLGLWSALAGKRVGDSDFCSIALPMLLLWHHEVTQFKVRGSRYMSVACFKRPSDTAVEMNTDVVLVIPSGQLDTGSASKRRRLHKDSGARNALPCPSVDLPLLALPFGISARSRSFFEEARRQLVQAEEERRQERLNDAMVFGHLYSGVLDGRPWWGSDGLCLLTLSCSDGGVVGSVLSRSRSLNGGQRPRAFGSFSRGERAHSSVVAPSSNSPGAVDRLEWHRRKNHTRWDDVVLGPYMSHAVSSELEADAKRSIAKWVFRVPRVQVLPQRPQRLVSESRSAGGTSKATGASTCSSLPTVGDAIIVPELHTRMVVCPRGGSCSLLRQMQHDELIAYSSVLSASPCHPAIDRYVRNQTCCALPEKHYLESDCGKLAKLGLLLRAFIEDGSKCVIFTQFSKMLDVLEAFANYHNFTYVRLDGTVKIDKRQGLVDRFNMDDRIFLFISSTRAGGVGINLTGANIVIFYDSDWNPAMDRQAQDRAHRIGQTREVHIHRLISQHTVEDNILQRQLQKRKLDDMVVDQGRFNTESLQGFSGRKAWTLGDVRSMLVGGAASTEGDQVGIEPSAADFEKALHSVEDEDDAEEAERARIELLETEQDFAQDFSDRLAGDRGGPSGELASGLAMPSKTSDALAKANHGGAGTAAVSQGDAWRDHLPPLVQWGAQRVLLVGVAEDVHSMRQGRPKGRAAPRAPSTTFWGTPSTMLNA